MRPITARKVRQYLGAAFFGALIGATLMFIAIVRSPHSHADPYTDKQKDLMFLQEVNQIVTVLDGPSLITHAKEGCVIALMEQNPHRVAETMWPYAKTLTATDITMVAAVAVSYYCPSVLNMASGSTGIQQGTTV